MLLSAVSVLVVAQSSSEIPEGLTNNPVQWNLNLETEYQTPKKNLFVGLTAAGVWFRTSSDFTTFGLLCLVVSL